MIGFTGPYSDVNFGDYAMLVNNIFTLDAEHATVFVYDRPFVERIQADYLSDRDITLIEVKIRSGAFSAEAETQRLTPLQVLREVENIDEITAAVTSLETLYVNGGGYLNSLWTMPHRIERLVKIIVPAIIAAKHGVPVVFTANGYGPFRGDTEFFAALFGTLSNATFGARDRILSPFWLAQAGVAADRIHHLPDDLLLIDHRLTPERTVYSEPYVVMETYLPVDYIAENFAHFKSFASALYDRYGTKTVFVPLNLGHGGVDQGRFLAEQLDEVELFDITTRGYLSIEDAVALVRGAELVISSRYHSLILALSAGTPFVSVLKDVLGDKQYYYGKNVGALDGVLGEQPHDLRDYFFMDYVEAMEAVAEDFEGITKRQRDAHESAFPDTSRRLRVARETYLKGDQR